MNRRTFLKALVAVPLAAVALPKVTPPTTKYVWNRTAIDFYAVMSPAQKKFYDELVASDSAYKLYGGAAGSGKSMTMSRTWNDLVRTSHPMFRSTR